MSGSIRGKPIEFDVVSETWSTYTIKDKLPVPLRGRVILTKVLKTDFFNELGEPMYATGTANPIFVTLAPRELAGAPTVPSPTQEQMSKAEFVDLEFERISEPWNEYKLRDGTIVMVKVLASNVRRTPFFVMDGDPLYFVSHDVSVRLNVPRDLRKK